MKPDLMKGGESVTFGKAAQFTFSPENPRRGMMVRERLLQELTEGKTTRVRISSHPSVKWHHEVGPYAGKEVEVTGVHRVAVGDFIKFRDRGKEHQISMRFVMPVLPIL